MDVKSIVKAARLRTLPLSVSGIIVGGFLGVNNTISASTFLDNLSNVFNSSIFWLAILTTVGFQVLSNFANDYGDGIKGTDDNREGEQRMVASGQIKPRQMKNIMIFTALFSMAMALLLIYASFGKENFLYSVTFFVLGIASIVAAIKYTVGKSAYGYSGFGDVFVFVFFGLLAVLGTYFLYAKSLELLLLLPAISIGLLSTAVLNLNNMRDRKNDSEVGKNTMVVKKGASWAKKYHYFLLLGSLVSTITFVLCNFKTWGQLLFILAYIPIIKHLYFVVKNKNESELDGELKKVAISTFFVAILLGFGQIL